MTHLIFLVVMGFSRVHILRAHLTPAAKGRQVSDMPDFLGLFSLKKSPNKTEGRGLPFFRQPSWNFQIKGQSYSD